MKTFVLIVIFSLLTGCAHSDGWSRSDTLMQIGVTTAMAADGYTTAQIHKMPGIEEGGPMARSVLGPNPSSTDTAMYFTSLAISHWLISRALPKKWRIGWQSAFIVTHGSAYANNRDLGLD